jgi:hypothetical protein
VPVPVGLDEISTQDKKKVLRATQDRTNAKRTNDTETLTRGKAAHEPKPQARDTDAPRLG